jgi:hypothetical protein
MLISLCRQRKDRQRACQRQLGNTSEDDADEASYGQHENRYKGEKPKHPKLLLIGVLIVAAQREHRDLLVKSNGPV